MNLPKIMWMGFAFSVAMLTAASVEAGNESNSAEVRRRVAANGWEVVWGIRINEAEYAKFIAHCYNGTPTVYFNQYLNRTVAKFQQNAPGIARGAVYRAVLNAFRNRGQTFHIGKVGVKAGIATYRRWYTQRVPDGTEKYKIYGPRNPITGKRTWTWGYRPRYRVKRISLPNHHQPYVAFRLYAPR